jgi:hypothetical protein
MYMKGSKAKQPKSLFSTFQERPKTRFGLFLLWNQIAVADYNKMVVN